MIIKNPLTPEGFIKAIFSTILMSCLISVLLSLLLLTNSIDFHGLFLFFVLTILSSVFSGFVFWYFFERYLIRERPDEFYEKVEPYDETKELS